MKNLTEGNIYKNFILFAVPIILSGLLSQMYSVVDSIIAGKYLGEHGLAAVGATAACITFVSSFFWGYSTGTSIYTAMLFGSEDYKALKTSIYSNAVTLIAASAAISLLSVIFKDFIFNMLNVDISIRKDASIYFVIYILGIFGFVLNHFGVCTMHALGISGFSLRMSVISTVINISGNILSVAVFKIGVAGIALSSVIAALVVCVCYYIKLQKCFKEMGCCDYKAKVSFKAIKKTFGFAVPVMLQQSVMYTTSLVIAPIVNAIGSSATAAYSIVLRIYDINAGVYQNSSKTLMNYTAQCIGAKKLDGIKKGVRVGFIQGLIFLAPFLIICVGFAEPFCSMFFPQGYTGAALEFSVVFVKYFLPFVVFNVINNLFHSFFRGIKAMNLLILFTAVGAVSRIIATIMLAKPYGMNGVYWGWIISWICEAVPVVILYFSGIWKKQLKNITNPMLRS